MKIRIVKIALMFFVSAAVGLLPAFAGGTNSYINVNSFTPTAGGNYLLNVAYSSPSNSFSVTVNYTTDLVVWVDSGTNQTVVQFVPSSATVTNGVHYGTFTITGGKTPYYFRPVLHER